MAIRRVTVLEFKAGVSPAEQVPVVNGTEVAEVDDTSFDFVTKEIVSYPGGSPPALPPGQNSIETTIYFRSGRIMRVIGSNTSANWYITSPA